MVLVADKGRYEEQEVVDMIQTESWNEYLSSLLWVAVIYMQSFKPVWLYIVFSSCLAIISPSNPIFPLFSKCFLRILLLNLSGRGISLPTHSL